jgi:hypothetical protein
MMPKPRLRAALASCALVAGAAACASTRGGEVEPRYVAVHNALSAMGLAQVGPIQRGSLATGREARLVVELAAGCTTLVALGGEGVRDLDATLLDPGGTPIAHDTTRDPEAVVRACVDGAGAYILVVKVADGAGEFLAATWSGGVDAPIRAAGGEAALASGTAPLGTCDSPIPVTAGQYNGSTTRGESENEGTCASAASREIVYRLELASRQRVTIDVVDPRFDSVLYVRKDDCAASEAEVACNDDVGHERRSRVDEVLEAGTYFVFVDGLSNESGPYRLKVSLEDVPTIAEVCRGARPLTAGLPLTGTTAGAFGSAESTCGDGAKGDDVAYRLDLAARSRVRVTEHSSDIAAVVHVRRTCTDEQSEVACADDGMTDDDVTYAGVLDPGAYTVFADSTGRDGDGRFTLLAETAPAQGAGAQGDTCGDALPITRAGRFEGDTFPSRDDVAGTCGGAGAADEVFRLDLPHRTRFTARLVKQEGHHVFVLTRACGDRAGEVACGAQVDQVLLPGTYWLAVDGATPGDLGRFAFETRLRDVAAQESSCKGAPPLHVGVVQGSTDGAGDKFTTSCGGREDIQSNPDRVYRLDLAKKTHVSLLLATPTWDGVLVVRRACMDPPGGTVATGEVRCNNDFEDTHHAKIDAVLDAGTYYVVVDGHASGNAGAFTLEYKVLR